MLIKEIMKKVKNWVKRKAALLSLAMANVEKNSLGQNSQPLDSDVNQIRRNTQGQLADSLLHGEITQEVLNLRWRNYKILKHVDGMKSEIIGYDEDNMPIVKTKIIDKTKGLDTIKIDTFDVYPLEMSFINDDISIGVEDSISKDYICEKKEVIKISDDTNAIADISGLEYYAAYKAQKALAIERTTFPKFDIEKYTTKLNIRTIDEEYKLLEFYVSKYPDEYNKTSKLFIKEVNKAIKNPLASNMLDIKTVSFISNNTIGSYDFMLYKYEITKFDKIIEFNGYYVVKFLAKTIINGEDILEKYKQKELDNKYDNKERKN